MSARFLLVITGQPYETQAPQSALDFARAAVALGHGIERVFLYGDGVHLASSLVTPPSDETDWPDQWQAFLEEHAIPATCCVASALRRGLLNEQEAKRYGRPASNVRSAYEVAGLGEWLSADQAADRSIYFNGL